MAVFGPSGKLQPEGIWTGKNAPGESFGRELKGMAISANLETQGVLYIASQIDKHVDVLAPAAGGSEPASLIGQLTGTCEKAEDIPPACAGSAFIPFAGPTGVAVSAVSGDVIVADGDVIDVFEPVAGMPGVYNFRFSIPGAPGEPFKDARSLAVDGVGDIYAVEQEANIVEQFNATGKYVSRLTGTPEGPFKELHSVAADPTSGNVYVGDFDPVVKTGAVDAFGPSSVVPDVTTGVGVVSVDGEGQIKATLNGTINPLNEGEATCAFSWGASKAFGQSAPCQESVPNANAPVAVKATIEGLAPDTTYFLRLQATNHNGTNTGEATDDKELATPGPGIHGQSVSDLASTSAKLNATIDPNNAPTSYYFQYGQNTAYEAQVPEPPGASLGNGKGDVQVAPQHIQGLSPGTVYHYRVVTVSQLDVEGTPTAVTFPGPDQRFTTQTALGGQPLPDGRHWELVSPPNKRGALLLAPKEAELIQAADNGGAIAYMATLPTEEGVKGYIYLGVPVLASRGPGGWSSQDISLAHAGASGLPLGLGYEDRFFTSDLSQAIVEPLGEFSSLAPEVFPPDSERGPYLRHDATCASAPGSCYRPLLVGCPAEGLPCAPAVEENADVPAGTKFGGIPTTGASRFAGAARFVGASSDLAHVILSSSVALTETPTDGQPQLYEFSPGRPASQQLQLLSAAANETGEAAKLGFANQVARHAVSEDGSRVVWSTAKSHLFLSDLGPGQTVPLDEPQGCAECEGEGEANAQFQLASADASRVLFTDTQRLTEDAGKLPRKADLYECKITAGACALTDLTPAPAPGHGQGADVQGAVIGSSEDGTWVYFVANGVLGDGAQRGASVGDCALKLDQGQGSCNLYVAHEGATHWIATVAGEDYPDWSGFTAGADLSKLTARVSPDGRWLAFMSDRSLTGYDNEDVTSKAAGERMDEEVFLYHAQSAGAGSLICASCNPTGARPVGVEYASIIGKLVGGVNVRAANSWIAANVPGWTAYDLARALHQPRYLSDSGRLFFNSNDALVAQDINRNQDAYQFEPVGVGDCSGASQTFSVASGGCVALISSGTASGESAFLDASENGDDIFFLTEERLVSNDVDAALDLYDAHVCTSAAPCLQEAEALPPCTTAEACRAAPAPQPSIFGSPSSATLSGQGNLTPTPPPPTRPKLTRKQLLAKALSACHRKYRKAKKRRHTCERQVRTRYGAKKARRANLGKTGSM